MKSQMKYKRLEMSNIKLFESKRVRFHFKCQNGIIE